MHPDLQKLMQVDSIDRELARLRAEVAALPRRVAEIETKLAGVNAEVEKGRKTLKDIEAARRKSEGDIQSLQQKISKYRDQMLAVKTNQEYKALGNEIEFTEQEIRLIEDRILEGMLETEQRERDLKSAEAEQKRQRAEVDKEKSLAQTRTQEDQARIDELLPQREELRKQIGADLVRHYDRVLKLRGTAIAEARDQRCMACHVQLRPQVFLDLMTSDEKVITCDSCGRIVYFDPANAAPPATSAAPARNAPTKESLEAAAEAPESS